MFFSNNIFDVVSEPEDWDIETKMKKCFEIKNFYSVLSQISKKRQ